ncbi:type VI secretion system tip protein VgrG [Paludibacterium purpuratum]|uniref:Rhs element Vgr protein n=1 Tax=Paludibacterium purpuratum TaxID=1144873 RepID=A0A4R7BDG3_9NEIS|nr:type VI secretion system tip protein VgrG [Paludibacterium purpuratum]TDR82773.1 Rhs element Vgr protein [Paludibacterium purpuratum]
MGARPGLDQEGDLRVKVSCDGKPQVDLPLVSLTVRRAFNRVPWAELIVQDGDMASGKFKLGDGNAFEPGTKVLISAGYGPASEPLFDGIVVGIGIKIDGPNAARLVVECRDPVCRMTLGRNNANYLQQKDSAIIGKLIGQYDGLTADVVETTLEHDELVQYDCSDWDFMLARAECNGLLVNVANGRVSVQPPQGQRMVGELAWGRDLYAFSAHTDARHQYTAARATAWDAQQLAIVQGSEAKPTALLQQGDLSGQKLAKVASPKTLALHTATQQEQAALTTWAEATQMKAALARIRGRLTCRGYSGIEPGAVIQVERVGRHFAGEVLVSAVEHCLDNSEWHAEVEFGLAPDWHMMRDDVQMPAAAGLLPGVGGLQIGVVLKLDGDPKDAQRIQIKLPVMQAETEGVWARCLQFYGSNGFGALFLPEVGDEVIVGYLNDDPSHPVVLGSLYSGKHAPPYPIEADNDTKAIVTRAKHKIEFNEKDKILTITTPGKNKLVLDDDDQSILIQDQHNNSIKLSQDGIALDTPYDITLSAKKNIKLDAQMAIELTAQANAKIAGLNIDCEAQAGFSGKGNAKAELSSTGQVTVSGSLVKIN